MPNRRPQTIQRMYQRIEQLAQNLPHYVDVFTHNRPFTGPSRYFHHKTIALRKKLTPHQAAYSTEFLEGVYATLTSWGMHRMGPGNTKLVEFLDLTTSFRQQADRIQALADLCICDLDPREVEDTSRQLWAIIAQLRVGVARYKTVAGSKALHHILPDLVPPIDRQYTYQLFYGRTTFTGDGEREFVEVYSGLCQIARTCRGEIRTLAGTGENTCLTKVIDNAIVGYVLKHLK